VSNVRAPPHRRAVRAVRAQLCGPTTIAPPIPAHARHLESVGSPPPGTGRGYAERARSALAHGDARYRGGGTHWQGFEEVTAAHSCGGSRRATGTADRGSGRVLAYGHHDRELDSGRENRLCRLARCELITWTKGLSRRDSAGFDRHGAIYFLRTRTRTCICDGGRVPAAGLRLPVRGLIGLLVTEWPSPDDHARTSRDYARFERILLGPTAVTRAHFLWRARRGHGWTRQR